MKAAGIFERSAIVIHGDHGSMIGKYLPSDKNLDQLTPVEYRANFSTLFVAKIPGQAGQTNDRVLSVSTLLESFSKTVETVIQHPERTPDFMQNIPEEKEKLESYVYLIGSYPQTRVDINIFED